MDFDPDKELFRDSEDSGFSRNASHEHGQPWRKTVVCSGLLLVFLCSDGFAAVIDVGNQPNEALPTSVKPVAGEVTLVADYAGKWPIGTIPVYLINASTNDVDLGAQDGDVYLKLEVEDPQGHWVRAQSHIFSWCGNSYFNGRKVRPGHFFLIEGYQPEKGEKRKVRYSFYHQELKLSSNGGRD